jgi:hypothetical protein
VNDVTDPNERRSSRSLLQLIAELPALLVNLLRAELNQLKDELAAKAKHAGIGIGLFVAAAILVLFAIGVLIAAAVLGLALVLPAWLAALIVAAALILRAVILALIGRSSIKRVGSLIPGQTVESVQEDVRAIKGIGKYDR